MATLHSCDGSYAAPSRRDRLPVGRRTNVVAMRQIQRRRFWWPPLSEGSSPGDASEAAALVLAMQELG
jgi:hypothetical protein